MGGAPRTCDPIQLWSRKRLRIRTWVGSFGAKNFRVLASGYGAVLRYSRPTLLMLSYTKVTCIKQCTKPEICYKVCRLYRAARKAICKSYLGIVRVVGKCQSRNLMVSKDCSTQCVKAQSCTYSIRRMTSHSTQVPYFNLSPRGKSTMTIPEVANQRELSL
jgi:hypothetical protein